MFSKKSTKPPKSPFMDISISKAMSGFYEGNNVTIAVVSKAVMVALVLWALIWPIGANTTLGAVNSTLLQDFNSFYIVITGFFAFFLFVLAIVPWSGKRKMGLPGEKPEFSNFSWFAMMFGAGLGVGLMVFATAEPLGLWGSNPVVLSGAVAANTAEAVESGYRYTFLHYGFHAWAIYVVVGLSMAYYAYSRGLPLTIRSTLTPILGKHVNGPIGHAVDIFGVIATILGISVTIGFGVSQLVDGLYTTTGMGWLMDFSGETPVPGTVGLIAGLIMIMGLSIISAVSGVNRGIKYLSNANLVMSFILLLVFAVFGSFLFSMSTYGTALVDYMVHFVHLSFGAFGPQSAEAFNAALPAEAVPFADALRGGATNAWGSYEGFVGGLEGEAASLSDATLQQVYAAGEPSRQFGWQSGWTTFYWAWWIAFAPFVGMFLARISKGRSVREFIVGCVLLPSLVCFAWMTILGGTSIDMELTGAAQGSIIGASNSAKLFVTLEQIVSGPLFYLIAIMCVVLILTFLVTSADSALLVMSTIISGGNQQSGIKHRIIWGVILTLVIASLLIAARASGSEDGMFAVRNAMIIGALPFTAVMGLMCIALAKAIYRDHLRDLHGVPVRKRR